MSRPPQLIVQCRRCGNVWQLHTALQAELQRPCPECGAGPDMHRREPSTPGNRVSLFDPRLGEPR